jgi:D-alanyl-D-alanine carboxypeptidase
VGGPFDIRNSICTAEAAAKRNEKRDERGRLVFDSPHLAPMTREPRLVQVSLIPNSVPKTGAIGQLVNVPRPTPRPDFMPLAYGQGG